MATLATITCSSMAAGRCLLLLLPSFFFGISELLGDAQDLWANGSRGCCETLISSMRAHVSQALWRLAHGLSQNAAHSFRYRKPTYIHQTFHGSFPWGLSYLSMHIVISNYCPNCLLMFSRCLLCASAWGSPGSDFQNIRISEYRYRIYWCQP